MGLWAILGLVIAVWVINTVLAAQQQQLEREQKRRRAEKTQANDRGEMPRQASDDLDRFLGELERLRKAEEEKTRKLAKQKARQQAQSQKSDSRRRESVRVEPAAPVVVESPVVAPESVVQAAFTRMHGVSQGTDPATAAPILTVLPILDASPTAVSVRVMLSKPETVRVAILLQEILGRPRCERPHHPGGRG